MNFDFTEEQKLFAESVRRFAQDHLAKDALKRAHSPHFPFDVARLMSRQGLLGITISEADGGQGGSLMDAVIAIEQTAAVCPRSADVVQFGNFGPIRTFSEYGSEYQKKKWLTECLAGNAVISLGMSEPEAGSAVTDLKTTAKQDGNGYVVNGTKVFSTFSPEASVFLVYLRYGPGVGGIGSMLVERGAPGFTIGPPQEFMSGELWSELHFDNCRIPAENVLLGPGGFKKQMASFNVERASTPTCASSSAAHSPNSRACNGSSPIWRSSSKARSFCSTARRATPTKACRRLTRPRWRRPPATRPASRWRMSRCRSWAPPATARPRWSNTACGAAAAG
jgi:alkylation response protein AidB-like acyl-CoA dehydrogenase